MADVIHSHEAQLGLGSMSPVFLAPVPADGEGAVLPRPLTVGLVCTLQLWVGSEPRAPAQLT